MSVQAASHHASAAHAGESSRNFTGIALIVGLLGLAIGLAGMAYDLGQGNNRFAISWLIGWSFWFTILIGMLFFVQIFHLFDAGWSVIVRRQMEHALSAMPWMALMLIPVVVLPWIIGSNPGAVWKWMNLEALYPSHDPIPVGQDPLYLHKAGYLNVPFFIARLVLYFAIFCGLAHVLRKYSINNDTAPAPGNTLALRNWSAAGVFLTSMAATFTAMDLYMSLTYHWFSTMYGVWFFSLSLRTALAATVVICFFLSTRGALKGIYNSSHNYFLGCLCFAFTVFWAYISFSQYFLIYNANIPEETFWYNIREKNPDGSLNSWWWVSMALIFCFFLVPFFTLLLYKTKVVAKRLLFICCWILFFALFDIYFNILPNKVSGDNILGYEVVPFLPNLIDLAVLLGVGGICVWALLRSMSRALPIPIHDPRIRESLNSSE